MQVVNEWKDPYLTSSLSYSIYKDEPLVQKSFKNQTSHFPNHIYLLILRLNAIFPFIKWIMPCRINRLLINES